MTLTQLARSLVRYLTWDIQPILQVPVHIPGRDRFDLQSPSHWGCTYVTKTWALPGPQEKPPVPLLSHWNIREETSTSPTCHRGKSSRETGKEDLAPGTHHCLHIPLIPCLAMLSPCQTTLPGLMSASPRAPGEPSRAGGVSIALGYWHNCPCQVSGSGERAAVSGAARLGSCMATRQSATLDSFTAHLSFLLVHIGGGRITACFSQQV